MELHLNIGQHKPRTKESVYDRIRKDWAANFQSAEVPQSTSGASAAPVPYVVKHLPIKHPLKWVGR
jgi:hypothetical protein